MLTRSKLIAAGLVLAILVVGFLAVSQSRMGGQSPLVLNSSQLTSALSAPQTDREKSDIALTECQATIGPEGAPALICPQFEQLAGTKDQASVAGDQITLPTEGASSSLGDSKDDWALYAISRLVNLVK